MKRNSKTYYDVYERPYEGNLYDDYPLDQLRDGMFPKDQMMQLTDDNLTAIMSVIYHYMLEYDINHFNMMTCEKIMDAYPCEHLFCLFIQSRDINIFIKSLRLFILNFYNFYDQYSYLGTDYTDETLVLDRQLYYKNEDGVITDDTVRFETYDETIRRIDYYFGRMCREFGTKYPWYKRYIKKLTALIIKLFSYIKVKPVKKFYYNWLTKPFGKILSW